LWKSNIGDDCRREREERFMNANSPLATSQRVVQVCLFLVAAIITLAQLATNRNTANRRPVG
jgi:hypothetical protein